MIEVQDIKQSPLAENPVIAQMILNNHEPVSYTHLTLPTSP
jgi:hypothetical protein